MRFSCRITRAVYSCLIIIASPRQQWLRERTLHVTLYEHCLCCICLMFTDCQAKIQNGVKVIWCGLLNIECVVSVAPLCVLRGWKWVFRHPVCWEDEVSVAPPCMLRGWSECCATLYVKRMKWMLRHPVCGGDEVSVASPCMWRGWNDCCATLYVKRMKWVLRHPVC